MKRAIATVWWRACAPGTAPQGAMRHRPFDRAQLAGAAASQPHAGTSGARRLVRSTPKKAACSIWCWRWPRRSTNACAASRSHRYRPKRRGLSAGGPAGAGKTTVAAKLAAHGQSGRARGAVLARPNRSFEGAGQLARLEAFAAHHECREVACRPAAKPILADAIRRRGGGGRRAADCRHRRAATRA